MKENRKGQPSFSFFSAHDAKIFRELDSDQILSYCANEHLPFISLVHELWLAKRDDVIYDICRSQSKNFSIEAVKNSIYGEDMMAVVYVLMSNGEDQAQIKDFVRSSMSIAEKISGNIPKDEALNNEHEMRVNHEVEQLYMETELLFDNRNAGLN